MGCSTICVEEKGRKELAPNLVRSECNPVNDNWLPPGRIARILQVTLSQIPPSEHSIEPNGYFPDRGVRGLRRFNKEFAGSTDGAIRQGRVSGHMEALRPAKAAGRD